MAIPPSTPRFDLKCGKGAISQGEKCHKGPATKTQEGWKFPAAIGGAVLVGVLAKKAWDANAAKRLADAQKSGFKFTPADAPPQATYLSAGNNGRVYISKDRKSIFKITTNREAMGKFAQELTTQETARALGVNTPKIRAADPIKGIVEMDFLDGYTPVDQALGKNISPAQKAAIRDSLISNMSKLHKAGWGHGDFHYKNVLFKDNKVALIDWGNGSKNMVRIREDIWRTIQLSKDLSSSKEREAISSIAKKFMDLSDPKQTDVDSFYDSLAKAVNTRRDALSPRTVRLDLKCGQSGISKGEKCHKGTPSQKALTAGAIGLGVGAAALGVGILATRKGNRSAFSSRSSSSSATPPSAPRPSGPPSLPGSSPRALLTPARIPKSKTQRMRENTRAAMQVAEGRIAQTAREEVRRVAQIGNTMAAAGEATGMAVKTGLREVRLRTEAARRRFEPGYRSGTPATPKAPAQLPEGGSAFQAPVNPKRTRPPEYVEELGQFSAKELRQWISTDPRTGQPKRRKAQGFGRSTRDNYIPHYATTYIDPARQRGDDCWEGYVQAGMKRKGKKEVPNCVPASSGLAKPKAQKDAEDGKKYTKVVTNPETGRKNKVRYGAKGYKIAPGTDKGDRYCARSFGDMQSEGYDCSGAERNTPLCLSRAKWKCSGKTSRRS